jgi:hypothetical protein
MTFGLFWALPELAWLVLGGSRAPLGHVWVRVGLLLACLGYVLKAFCLIQGVSWAPLGSFGCCGCVQGAFWDPFGQVRARLVCCFAFQGRILRVICYILGVSYSFK